jgi:PPOX class probable F420-dependent enzyme
MPRLGPDEARRRFAGARVARLATVRPDGQPHLVPIVFATDDDRVVAVVDAKPKASRRLQRLQNIAANPAVAVLVDHYDEDWDAIWWVRADGQARVIESSLERERAIDQLRAKYSQDASLSREEFGAAIVVSIERWVGWTARR